MFSELFKNLLELFTEKVRRAWLIHVG